MRAGVVASALLVALSACVDQDIARDEESLPLECDGRFRVEGLDEQQTHDVHVAASRWNTFLGRDYFRIVDVASCSVRAYDLSEYSDGRVGHWEAPWGAVLIDLERAEAYGRARGPGFQTIVMHEFGHSIGLGHAPGHALMNGPDGTTSEDFTEADRIECMRVGACS